MSAENQHRGLYLSILVAILAFVGSFFVPEVRQFLGLDPDIGIKTQAAKDKNSRWLLVGTWRGQKIVRYYANGTFSVSKGDGYFDDGVERFWTIEGNKLIWRTPWQSSESVILELNESKLVVKDSDGNVHSYARSVNLNGT